MNCLRSTIIKNWGCYYKLSIHNYDEKYDLFLYSVRALYSLICTPSLKNTRPCTDDTLSHLTANPVGASKPLGHSILESFDFMNSAWQHLLLSTSFYHRQVLT